MKNKKKRKKNARAPRVAVVKSEVVVGDEFDGLLGSDEQHVDREAAIEAEESLVAQRLTEAIKSAVGSQVYSYLDKYSISEFSSRINVH